MITFAMKYAIVIIDARNVLYLHSVFLRVFCFQLILYERFARFSRRRSFYRAYSIFVSRNGSTTMCIVFKNIALININNVTALLIIQRYFLLY